MCARRAKLFNFMQERDAIMKEVVDRVVRGHTQKAKRSQDKHLDYILNEAAFLEMQRLSQSRSNKLDLHSYDDWHGLARSIARTSESQKIEKLRGLVETYCEDVVGKFTPAVFKFATSILPMALGFAFNAQSFDSLFKNFRGLTDRIIIQGEVDTLRKLAEKGTLIVVPTHSSNLDSIIVGWALEQCGLPPVTYGAGKNLFSHPLMSFFMRNLGAYRVDRRLRHVLYKDVLKTYSGVLIERGFHSLFFPGGTRSRSNEVEERLKLGLLGTAMDAYTNNLQAGKDERIYICPLTINYHLAIEAESLIQEHLRRDGGARFIVEDDEFSDVKNIIDFSMKMMSMEYTLYLHFAPPIDPFGNPVDATGASIDPHGRPIDTKRYLWVDGVVADDPQRNAEYTRECGRAIGRSFKQHSVVLSSPFLAFVLFHYLRELYPQFDLYRLLRVAKGELVPFNIIHARAEVLREKLQQLNARGEILLARDVASDSIPDLVERGTQVLQMYHSPTVVEAHPNGLEVANPNLLHFYSNRLANYDLDDCMHGVAMPTGGV